jgi:hypothetical protein
MWYLFTMEFYSAMRKDEILSFTNKWMELKNIILREVSQAQKDKSHMIPHMQIVDLKQMQQNYGTRSH